MSSIRSVKGETRTNKHLESCMEALLKSSAAEQEHHQHDQVQPFTITEFHAFIYYLATEETNSGPYDYDFCCTRQRLLC
jgi:hypothetical protein